MTFDLEIPEGNRDQSQKVIRQSADGEVGSIELIIANGPLDADNFTDGESTTSSNEELGET